LARRVRIGEENLELAGTQKRGALERPDDPAAGAAPDCGKIKKLRIPDPFLLSKPLKTCLAGC